MTMQQLYYALTIAKTKSLNKAAEILYMTQPSLTSALKELENELGFPLFNRTSKGVTLTNDGQEFLAEARQLYLQYELLLDKYESGGKIKKKFNVSTQHYSFAVKAFVNTVKQFDTSEFDFSILETRTRNVIQDVADSRSEIGILYLSDYNRKIIEKLLKKDDLEFHPIVNCRAYVYLHWQHPLAHEKAISLEQLYPYPCLVFVQGDDSSAFFAEEILSDVEYPKIIHTSDRATNLNLMRALNAFTLCSGIISEDLNGSEFVAIPFKEDEEHKNTFMNIGYIVKKNSIRSEAGNVYIRKLQAETAGVSTDISEFI